MKQQGGFSESGTTTAVSLELRPRERTGRLRTVFAPRMRQRPATFASDCSVVITHQLGGIFVRQPAELLSNHGREMR